MALLLSPLLRVELSRASSHSPVSASADLSALSQDSVTVMASLVAAKLGEERMLIILEEEEGIGMALQGRVSFLNKGSMVETKPTGRGFKGSWYEARILRPPQHPDFRLKRGRLTLVEFESLLAEDCSGKLAEGVDARVVRPRPPLWEHEEFREGDAVEGRYADGWWIGTVAEVRDGGISYWVEFEDPPDAAELGKGDLRARWDWDWATGSWVQPRRFQEANVEADKTSSHGVDLSSPLNFTSSSDPSKKPKVSGELCSLTKRHSTDLGDEVFDAAPLCALASSSFGETETAHCEDPPNSDIHPPHDELDTPSPRERVIYAVTPDNAAASSPREGVIGVVTPVTAASQKKWLDGLKKTRTYHRRKERTSTPTRKRERSSNVGCQNAGLMSSSAANDPSRRVSYEGSASMKATAKPAYTRIATQIPETGHLQPDSSVQECAVVKAQPLPFIKSSPIWKTVDSLKALQKFPQNPHFCPLVCCNEDTREGMAISNMVNFALTVDKIFNLQITDPISCFYHCLEILLDLEPHGFNVMDIETHLRKLLEIKEGQRKRQERSREMENRISELSQENAKIDEDMERLQARKAENETRLGSLRRSVDAMEAMNMMTEMRWPNLDF